MVLVGLLVIVWNSAAFGYYGLDNVLQPALFPAPEYLRLQLPIAIFTISSPALGLVRSPSPNPYPNPNPDPNPTPDPNPPPPPPPPPPLHPHPHPPPHPHQAPRLPH